MSDFVSILDIKECGDILQQRALKDEMAALDFEFRKRMDAGLAPYDMRKAVAIREAAQAASAILNNIFM